MGEKSVGNNASLLEQGVIYVRMSFNFQYKQSKETCFGNQIGISEVHEVILVFLDQSL